LTSKERRIETSIKGLFYSQTKRNPDKKRAYQKLFETYKCYPKIARIKCFVKQTKDDLILKNACYRNALLFSHAYKVTYVQGVVCRYMFPGRKPWEVVKFWNHGWNVNKKGTVIDLTWGKYRDADIHRGHIYIGFIEVTPKRVYNRLKVGGARLNVRSLLKRKFPGLGYDREYEDIIYTKDIYNINRVLEST